MPHFNIWRRHITDGVLKRVHEVHSKVIHSRIISLSDVNAKDFIEESKHDQEHAHVNGERNHVDDADDNELSQQSEGLIDLHEIIGLEHDLQNIETEKNVDGFIVIGKTVVQRLLVEGITVS